MIKISALNKYFNKGRQNELRVINDVSLELADRGMVAIFGKSGCGKTTLLNVIGGLDSFASGSLTLEGEDITRDTDTIRNKYVGYIFQNYNLNKEATCFDNVADALRLCGMTDSGEIEKRVMAALTNVDMQNYKLRTPDTLSGGQQQRIAIARAIVKAPRIILADEPTGNLDEANTVMIMDLLKAISRDHLVLLVTHEAELVDHYCDTVIELSDGKIASYRSNDSAFGYSAKDKNRVYLGELEKNELKDDRVSVDFYGDTPEAPIKLTLVNDGGKLYVKIDTEKVRVLDESSELKLVDGVYEQKKAQSLCESKIDMSALGAFEGKRFGKLFNFKSSAKSGYAANFKRGKKGKKLLRRCMSLFAMVIVLMSAVFGTSIGKLIDAKNSYHHNVFYLYTPDESTSQKLIEAVGKEDSGIDGIRLLSPNAVPRDTNLYFNLGYFESFNSGNYSYQFSSNAVLLDSELSKDLTLLEGSRDALEENEILITSKVADTLIENSPFEYIDSYSDLIGLTTSNYNVEGNSLIIAGVLDSKEPSVYLTPLAMARSVLAYSQLSVIPDTDYAKKIAEGEALFINRVEANKNLKLPSLDDIIEIRGKELKVTEIKKVSSSYANWLTASSIKKQSERQYFTELTQKVTSLDKNSAEFEKEYQKLVNERYFEYLDYYYSELDTYLEELYSVEPHSYNLWLYVKKGAWEIKYTYINEPNYYAAALYKKDNGRYPTLEEAKRLSSKNDVYSAILRYEDDSSLYKEFNSTSYNRNSDYSYVISENDYIALSKQVGDTHPSAISGYLYYDDYYYGDKYGGGIVYETAVESKAVVDFDVSYSYSDIIITSEIAYTVIHSTDPKVTERFILSSFGDLDTGMKYRPAIVTPDSLFEQLLTENKAVITAGLITVGIILAILSVCMYFIMRSSLMNRIKEIGIYRAIGVTRKNLVFKFLVEAMVLTVLTVFVGYLLTSAFIYACLGLSSMVSEVLFYPAPMALSVLALLVLLCLFCGTLPILLLLRRTPSEILSKYDI